MNCPGRVSAALTRLRLRGGVADDRWRFGGFPVPLIGHLPYMIIE
jgi:hypothetical protein